MFCPSRLMIEGRGRDCKKMGSKAVEPNVESIFNQGFTRTLIELFTELIE